MKYRTIDAIVQGAAHPSMPKTIGGNLDEVFATDCFIADSKEVGILTLKETANPKVLGILLPACCNYTDISCWEKYENIPAIELILEMLLNGKIDSGLVYTSYAKITLRCS